MSEITKSTENNVISNNNTIRKRNRDFSEDRGKRLKLLRDQRRGFSESSFEEAEYYIENYLRKVYPYYFTYTTFCKGRWVGKKLIDVFSEEFHVHTKEEYEKNIKAGNIKINGNVINCDYTFKENDCVTNKAHRHETAVVNASIKIIYSNEEFVVIDKPPSVPVHPCGRYRHNSLLFILAKEHNLKELYSVHRLDRLTSGLLVFTKTIRKSQEVNEQIRDRKVEKVYVCRVEGDFPDGAIICKEPIEVISPKMGICIVSSTGKECETEFHKINFNGKSSVVLCKPLTGRMHQIRVHLQYLGHPIINDPIYNHEDVFGPNKGKKGDIGKSKEQLLENLLKTHNLKKWLLDDSPVDPNSVTKYINLNTKENEIALLALKNYMNDYDTEKLKKYVKCSEKFKIDSACDLCHQTYMDPEPKDLVLFLHALKYKGHDWSFETEMPVWAKEEWIEC